MATRNTRRLRYFAILLSIFVNNVSTQDRPMDKDIKWSPSDKRFEIIVPQRLEVVETDKLRDDQHIIFGHNKLYATSQGEFSFGIYELELASRGMKRTLDEKFNGLEFLIGGEDLDFAEIPLKINGRDARQVTFANSKGLMVDGGDRIYVLVMLALENPKDLESEAAKRFFSSFKLLK